MNNQIPPRDAYVSDSMRFQVLVGLLVFGRDSEPIGDLPGEAKYPISRTRSANSSNHSASRRPSRRSLHIDFYFPSLKHLRGIILLENVLVSPEPNLPKNRCKHRIPKEVASGCTRFVSQIQLHPILQVQVMPGSRFRI